MRSRSAAPKAKVLNRERVRFEIAVGNYRLVAAFDFRRQIEFVKFVAAHAEYDHIDAVDSVAVLRRPPWIRPIRTDEEHRAALAEIEASLGAREVPRGRQARCAALACRPLRDKAMARSYRIE